MKSISVVIPVHNEEKFIAMCLSSLKNQTVKPDEILLVDNNCTDKSIEIAKHIIPNIRVVKEKRQGVIYARNTGFDECKSEIIARIDADTFANNNWVELCKENFEKGIVGLAGRMKLHDGGILNFFSSTPYELIVNYFYGHKVMHGGGMAILKSAWDKVKSDVCQDEKIVHEDLDLSIHISKLGKIQRDPNWVVWTSARNILRPKTLAEYIQRNVRTLKFNRKNKS